MKTLSLNNTSIIRLPQFNTFYPELLNSIKTSPETTCSAIYTRFDSLALERVVGTGRAQRMLVSDRNVHVFA